MQPYQTRPLWGPMGPVTQAIAYPSQAAFQSDVPRWIGAGWHVQHIAPQTLPADYTAAGVVGGVGLLVSACLLCTLFPVGLITLLLTLGGALVLALTAHPQQRLLVTYMQGGLQPQ